MTRIALKSGSMVSINGMLMAFDRELGDESLVFTRLPTGIPWLVGEREEAKLPNWSNVEAALAIGEFKILGNVENLPLVRKPYAAVEDALAFDGNAAIRAHYVRQFDNAPVGLGKNSLKDFIERVSTGAAVDKGSRRYRRPTDHRDDFDDWSNLQNLSVRAHGEPGNSQLYWLVLDAEEPIH
jgi:hypothetical protein